MLAIENTRATDAWGNGNTVMPHHQNARPQGRPARSGVGRVDGCENGRDDASASTVSSSSTAQAARALIGSQLRLRTLRAVASGNLRQLTGWRRLLDDQVTKVPSFQANLLRKHMDTAIWILSNEGVEGLPPGQQHSVPEAWSVNSGANSALCGPAVGPLTSTFDFDWDDVPWVASMPTWSSRRKRAARLLCGDGDVDSGFDGCGGGGDGGGEPTKVSRRRGATALGHKQQARGDGESGGGGPEDATRRRRHHHHRQRTLSQAELLAKRERRRKRRMARHAEKMRRHLRRLADLDSAVTAATTTAATAAAPSGHHPHHVPGSKTGHPTDWVVTTAAVGNQHHDHRHHRLRHHRRPHIDSFQVGSAPSPLCVYQGWIGDADAEANAASLPETEQQGNDDASSPGAATALSLSLTTSGDTHHHHHHHHHQHDDHDRDYDYDQNRSSSSSCGAQACSDGDGSKDVQTDITYLLPATQPDLDKSQETTHDQHLPHPPDTLPPRGVVSTMSAASADIYLQPPPEPSSGCLEATETWQLPCGHLPAVETEVSSADEFLAIDVAEMGEVGDATDEELLALGGEQGTIHQGMPVEFGDLSSPTRTSPTSSYSAIRMMM